MAITRTGTDAINKYQYNGKEKQPETGYLDYGARMYMPEIGRWGAVDPLAEHPNQVDKSLYSAFWNNPVKYTDPDGRCPDCPDEVYVPLSDHVYNATEGSSVNGWTVVKGGIYENTETGFKGALYQGSGEWEGQYIFATAGTDFTSLKDWQNNIQQITTGESAQYGQSVELAGQLSADYQGVSFTGHSLGGGLASANALAVEGKAVTFNAAGLSNATKDNLRLTGNKANISAYVVRGEAVNYFQGMVGLKAEGKKIKTLPASYSPIAITPTARMIRAAIRTYNHTMGVVKEKYNEINNKK